MQPNSNVRQVSEERLDANRISHSLAACSLPHTRHPACGGARDARHESAQQPVARGDVVDDAIAQGARLRASPGLGARATGFGARLDVIAMHADEADDWRDERRVT